jgi:hypothetical protein
MGPVTPAVVNTVMNPCIQCKTGNVLTVCFSPFHGLSYLVRQASLSLFRNLVCYLPCICSFYFKTVSEQFGSSGNASSSLPSERSRFESQYGRLP